MSNTDYGRLRDEIQCIVDSPAFLPQRAHPTDAGADLLSTTSVVIEVGYTVAVNTGVSVKIPKGAAGFVFSRSSQGKIGVSLANSVGLIDSDYRGPLIVLLTNNGDTAYTVEAGKTKVAQLVVVPVYLPVFVDIWNDTARGKGGFGSTDSKTN